MNTASLVGESAYVDADVPDVYLPDRLWQVSPKKHVDPEWFALLVGSLAIRRRLKMLASGTSGSMKNISQKQFRSIAVTVPPREAQAKSATVLGRCNLAIDQLTKVIAAKRAFKRGLMHDLLTGRRRFPEFVGCEAKRVRLGDICHILIGGTPSRDVSDYWATHGNGFLWVSIGDMKGRWIYNTKERITQAGIDNSNVKLVSSGTTLMSFKLSIGRVARAGSELYTNEAIAAFVPTDDTISAEYLYEILPLAARATNADMAVKGAILSKGKLAEIMLRVPSKEEQARIAAVGERLDHECSLLQALVERVAELKRGLMQKLLSGNIEVPQGLGRLDRGPDHDGDKRHDDS
jgi:restriction endonuclease S subunit